MRLSVSLIWICSLLMGCSSEAERPASAKMVNMPYVFNHEAHSKTIGCVSCHEKFCTTKECIARITMNDIFTGKYCGSCHDGSKAFAFSQCDKCHTAKGFNAELTYKNKDIGPAVFSHKFHALFSCNQCHPKQFALKKTKGKMTMARIRQGKFCGACHNKESASSKAGCLKCHIRERTSDSPKEAAL